ncbi:MAG: AAA family ATPase [Campylobacterota bacterium]|nr:AAA family ATPase [Campylobacterota bacterium]
MAGVLLEELYIHNFKSFYKSKFEFGKVNCIIAPNNSGKSNLMAALKFLDNLLYDNSVIAIHNVGYENIRNFHYDENIMNLNAKFSIKNKVLIDKELIDYSISLLFLFRLDSITKKQNIDIIVSGKIKSTIIDSDDLINGLGLRVIRNLSDYIKNYKNYRELLDKKVYRSFDFTYNHFTLNYNLTTRYETTKEIIKKLFVLNIKNDEYLQSQIEFSKIFSKNSLFQSHYFQTHEMKRPEPMGINYLYGSGKNLPEFLVYLYDRDKELFNDIAISLIGEVELVNSIEVRDESIPELIFKEELNDKSYHVSIQDISDGTLHFIAIMTAIIGDKLSQGIMIEEPERHMHMKVLTYILNTMRDDTKQIFFTTHSTEILQQLDLDEIIFMFRDYDGNTKGQRAKDIPNIKKIMKLYKNDLVSMIQMGVVGEYDE